LLGYYERFLADTDSPEDVLVERFLTSKKSDQPFSGANELGDLVFEIIEKIGQGNRFHRLLVV
jgi:hypothetical protein